MTITGETFDTASEAIQHTYASGQGEAISVAGRYMVVAPETVAAIDAAGTEFGLYTLTHDNKLICIPSR